MDLEYIRARLRDVMQLIAEVQVELSEKEIGPHLVLVDDDFHAGETLRGRDFEQRDNLLFFPGSRQIHSETGSREAALNYSQEEIEKMPRLQDGHFRTTADGYCQVRYRRDGYNVQFTSKDPKVVKSKFLEWCRSVNEETRARNRKAQAFCRIAEQFFATVKRANVSADVYHGLWRSVERGVAYFAQDRLDADPQDRPVRLSRRSECALGRGKGENGGDGRRSSR